PAIAALIRDDLGLSLTQAGSFLSVYYLGPVTMSFFAGMLADRWGTAKTLVLGQVLIAAGLLAVSRAGSYGVMLAFLGIAVVGLALLTASRYLALAQAGGVLGRIAFGVLSDRTFGGRRRTPLAIAGCGSAVCSLGIAFTGPAAGPALLAPLALVFGFFGIG